MNQWRATWHFARWEFHRYFKVKQQVISMVLTFAVAAATVGVMRVAQRSEGKRAEVAAIGLEKIPLRTAGNPTVQGGAASKYHITGRAASEEAQLRDAVKEGIVDGLLIIRDRDHAEILTRKRGDWTAQLQLDIAASRQQAIVHELALDATTISRLYSTPDIQVTVQRRDGSPASRATRAVVMIVLGLMVLAVFMGVGYIFTSITGEKQIRVTEQIVSAIPAQSWIDGKILGLLGVCIVSIINLAATSAAMVAIMLIKAGKPLNVIFQIPTPGLTALVIGYAILGLLFWFSFLAVVAASIDDPNSSTRGPLLMVPVAATALAFLIAKAPDSTFARILSLFPVTAPSAMPVRVILTDVPAYEIGASLALLLGSVHLMRAIAGRVFRVAMLMYGKEPSWGEIRRWAFQRASRARRGEHVVAP